MIKKLYHRDTKTQRKEKFEIRNSKFWFVPLKTLCLSGDVL